MLIGQEVQRFARWTLGVSRKLLRIKPWMTIAAVVATASRGVLQLLAFMVPLKVILLAASPGVPSYFPFIDPSDKALWISVLAGGAIGIYITVQLLGPAIERLLLSAGQDLLRQANDLPVASRDKEQILRVFGDFISILAALLFLGAATTVLLWISPALIIWLFIAIMVLFFLSVLVMKGDSLPAPPLKSWVTEKYRDYVGVWEALTFFGAFGIILWPFLNGSAGSVFLALVSFILVRRMVTELGGIIRRGVNLTQQRASIDALLYKRHVAVSSGDNAKSRLFRELFARESRNRIFADMLALQVSGPILIDSIWQDPVPPQVKHFRLKNALANTDSGYQFDARVYGPDTQFQAEHASFLFRFIPYSSVKALPCVAQINENGFLISILQLEYGHCVTDADWKDLKPRLEQDVMSVIPPQSLVKSYRNTHAMLDQRLSVDLFARLEAAIDTERDALLLERWRDRLPAIQQWLQQQPIALVNPDLVASNVLKVSEDEWCITYWGRWRLEPLGAAIAQFGLVKSDNDLIAQIAQKRKDLTSRLWVNDIELAATCHTVYTAVTNGKFKKAFDFMAIALSQYESL